MTRLAEVQDRLLETNAAMAQLEQAIAHDAESLSLSAMMKSLEKRYQDLETAFLTEVDLLGIDVCSYRLFGDDVRPTLKAVSSILGDFQDLVSTVYDAVKTGVPKVRARIAADIAAETEFRLGYTFPGSMGLVLTIPNQRLLIGESHLDESLRVISDMARLHDSPEVLEYAKKLGPASIRKLYTWAYDHAQYQLGVDIQWRRREDVRVQLFAQRPELQKLHETISATSDERTSVETMHADLVGADVLRRSFHMKLDSGEEVRGTFSADLSVSEEQTLELPKRYGVRFRKTQRILYSTDEEVTEYQLLMLERLS